MTIHATAVIGRSAILGAGVTIGPYVCIDDGVVLGDGCVVGPHVCILRGSTLGPNCRVHAGAVIGDVPQDLGFFGAESFVRIGSDCEIREGVTIHRATQPGATTTVGSHCMLMAHSHVAHDVRMGDHVVLVNNALLAGHVEVGDRAVISANCLVHQFTRVGRLAMMAGASGVQLDVPPFCVTRSMHTNTVMNLNVVGLRRAGMPNAERRELQYAFRILYSSGLIVSRAVERLEAEFDSPNVRELVEFIKASRRGICKFIRESDEEAQDRPRVLVA